MGKLSNYMQYFVEGVAESWVEAEWSCVAVWRWMELGGAGWSWVELGGVGWSWVELGARFSNTQHKHTEIEI